MGGALGAIVLAGAGVLFWLYRRKKRNNQNGPPTSVAPSDPMMHQNQPYSPSMRPVGSPEYSASAYGGMAPSHQRGQSVPTSPQPTTWGTPSLQHYPLGPQQPQHVESMQPNWGHQQQPYTDYNRPPSNVSAAGITPLPMWVERASRAPAEGMSVTTAEHGQPGANQP